MKVNPFIYNILICLYEPLIVILHTFDMIHPFAYIVLIHIFYLRYAILSIFNALNNQRFVEHLWTMIYLNDLDCIYSFHSHLTLLCIVSIQ